MQQTTSRQSSWFGLNLKVILVLFFFYKTKICSTQNWIQTDFCLRFSPCLGEFSWLREKNFSCPSAPERDTSARRAVTMETEFANTSSPNLWVELLTCPSCANRRTVSSLKRFTRCVKARLSGLFPVRLSRLFLTGCLEVWGWTFRTGCRAGSAFEGPSTNYCWKDKGKNHQPNKSLWEC